MASPQVADKGMPHRIGGRREMKFRGSTFPLSRVTGVVLNRIFQQNNHQNQQNNQNNQGAKVQPCLA